MRKGRITAAEAMARLNADPEFVARRELAERELRAREEEWRRAEAPLVHDLRGAGLAVQSVWDLVNTAAPYTEVLSILLEHLQLPYPVPVREGIARALAVPQAKFALGALFDLYRKECEKRAKDGLAVAIAAIADDDDIDTVITLVRDPKNGTGRVLLLSALERSRAPQAQATLREFERDPEIGNEVQRILRGRRRR